MLCAWRRADALRRAQRRQFAQERPGPSPRAAARPWRRSERSLRSRSTTRRGSWCRAVAPSSAAAIRPRDRDHGLQERGGERQHDAALPGLLVGDKIGRRSPPCRGRGRPVEHPIGERNSHQQPHRAAVRLGGADRAGGACGRILPAWRAASPRCHRRRGAEAAGGRGTPKVLRDRLRLQASDQNAPSTTVGEDCLAPSAQGRHGHVTEILLENRAPKLFPAPGY